MADDEIKFEGRDGHECEEFIRAIYKAAYAAGRLRDDAWMADLAVPCFSGRALRYYESLEPEVQCDWRLLRKALLAWCPPSEGDADGIQPGESRILAAVAPMDPHGPQPNARIGKIKVIGANSTDFGYLGYGEAFDSTGIGAGAPAAEAISICYVPANQLFEIKIQRSDNQPQLLGVHWFFPSPSTEIGSLNYANLTAFNYEGLYRSSKLMRAGPGYTRIWSIMADNSLCPHLDDNSSHNPLHFFVLSRSEYKRYTVDVAADAGAFVTKHGSFGWTLVTLLFEPIV